MRITSSRLTCLLLVGTALCSNLHAQSINYKEMEDLFNEPVTASVTGKPIRASDSPVAMEIITAEDIRRSGATTLPEVMRHYPGINVTQAAQGQYDVSIRGYNQMNSNRLLVLLNGKQIIFDHFGEMRWDMIPVQMEEIRQVEIVKGPNSSLYGFNAEQGVINIVTYNPIQDDVNGASAALGTQNYKQVGAVGTLQHSPNLALRVSGGNHVADDYTFHNEAVWLPAEGNWRGNKLNLDAEYLPDDKSTLRLQTNLVDSTNRYVASYSFFQYPVDTRATGVQLDYTRDTSLGLIGLQGFRNSVVSTNGAKDSNRLWGIKTSDLFKLSADHTIRLGLEYRHNSVAGGFLDDSQFHYDLYAPSAMWDWQINPDLSLVASTRHDIVHTARREAPAVGAYAGNKDAFNQSRDATSYNLAMLYKSSDATRWRLAAGRGFHIPSLLESGAGSFSLQGNPQLETETNQSYEAGVTHKLDNGLELGTNLFHQFHTNLITSQGFSYANNGSSKAYGVELSARQKLDAGHWGTALTSIYTDDDARNIAMQFENNTPKLQASFYGGINLTPSVQLDGDITWYSSSRDYITDPFTGFTSGQLVDIDDYAAASAQIAYFAPGGIRLALVGQNLLGAHHEGPKSRATITNVNIGVREIPRTFMLKMSYGF